MLQKINKLKKRLVELRTALQHKERDAQMLQSQLKKAASLPTKEFAKIAKNMQKKRQEGASLKEQITLVEQSLLDLYAEFKGDILSKIVGSQDAYIRNTLEPLQEKFKALQDALEECGKKLQQCGSFKDQFEAMYDNYDKMSIDTFTDLAEGGFKELRKRGVKV